MKIRKRVTPAGTVSWRLDLGMINGRRVLKTYPTEIEARGALELAKAEVRQHGVRSLEVSHSDRSRLQYWLEKLPEGKTIDDVFRFFLVHHVGLNANKPIEVLLVEYRLELERLERTTKYIRTSIATLKDFFCGLRDVELAEINRAHVLPFIAQVKAAASQRNRLGAIRAFFEWTISCRYIMANPLTGAANRIRIAREKEKEILSLSPSDAKRLLEVAQKDQYQPLLGFLTAALFCGVRPEEIYRTPVSTLELDQRVFRINAKASKTAQKRVIELSPAAVSWFQKWKEVCPDQSTFRPPGWQKRWASLRSEAGLQKKWVPDVLRHTFASMHYAKFQNASTLKAQMGHSQSEETLFRHYRAVQTVDGQTITQNMAEEFWALKVAG